MADKPTRGRASKVWLLPESIRNALNEMLRDKGNSQAAILDEINGLIEEAGLPDDLKLSRSGLSRHASQVEQVGQHLRDLRETTAALTSQLGDKPMGRPPSSFWSWVVPSCSRRCWLRCRTRRRRWISTC